MRGRIFSVNILEYQRPGKPHHPQKNIVESAILGKWGFEGDFHNRELRESFSKPGTLKPNTDRHITLVAMEVLDELNAVLGLDMIPGTLGENITTKDLGDLSDIADGSRIIISNTNGVLAILRVVEQNMPCVNLSKVHRELAKRIHGRRGLLCAIEHGTGKCIMPQDTLQVLSPA